MAAKRSRPPRFNIELSGNEEQKRIFHDAVGKVKALMGVGTTNTEALMNALTKFILNNGAQLTWDSQPQETQESSTTTYGFTALSSVEAKQEVIYLCGSSSLQKLTQMTNDHGHACNGKIKLDFNSSKGRMNGFWCKIPLSCSLDDNCKAYCTSTPYWSTSDYISNEKSFVNMKMAHSFLSSGMLPSYFTRLMESAGIKTSTRFMQNISKNSNYFNAVEKVIVI